MKQQLSFIYIILITLNFACNKNDEVVDEYKPVFEENVDSLPPKCCTCLEEQGISDKYNYPYLIDDLKQFDDYRLKLEACQIPDDTLNRICTKGLVETYYEFPLLGYEFFKYNSVKVGLKGLEEEFNGFRELLSREDATEKLLQRYLEREPTSLDTASSIRAIGNLQLYFDYQEITLGYDSICERFTSAERRTLIQHSLKVLKKKKEFDYLDHCQRITMYLIGNLLVKENFQPFIDNIKNNELSELISGIVVFPSGTDFKVEYFAEMYLSQTNND